jgi:hypothetical protein
MGCTPSKHGAIILSFNKNLTSSNTSCKGEDIRNILTFNSGKTGNVIVNDDTGDMLGFTLNKENNTSKDPYIKGISVGNYTKVRCSYISTKPDNSTIVRDILMPYFGSDGKLVTSESIQDQTESISKLFPGQVFKLRGIHIINASMYKFDDTYNLVSLDDSSNIEQNNSQVVEHFNQSESRQTHNQSNSTQTSNYTIMMYSIIFICFLIVLYRYIYHRDQFLRDIDFMNLKKY